MEATIQSAIDEMQTHIATKVRVGIRFVNVHNGLGGSAQGHPLLPYSTWLADVKKGPQDAYDRTALATLPPGPGNPANGNTELALTNVLVRAVGEEANYGPIDAKISLNFGLMNVSRTGPQNPEFYDAKTVILHELDEVLGVGGGGSTLADDSGTNPPGALDLYRYNAPGVRTFTTEPEALNPYFSIDGGNTVLSYFRKFGAGGDTGDFDNDLDFFHQVQDAFGAPGAQLDLGVNEWKELDVVGYTLNAATFINELIATVNALQLTHGPSTALTKMLANAKRAVAKNHPQAAASAIQDFDSAVNEFLASGVLTSAQAAQLSSASANIEAILGA